MHLDAGLGGVPAGGVAEAGGVEVGVQVAVEAGEDVAVEGGGDSLGVVVGGEEGGDGLVGAGGEVGAEQEGVAGVELGAEVGEDAVGFSGGEVADAGADVEGQDLVVRRSNQRDGVGDVVGDLGVDVDAGDGLLQGLGLFEAGGADVDGLVEDVGLDGGGGAEEDAGLGGGACAELGEGDGSVQVADDVRGVGGEDGAFGAGEVVLGEGGDLLEEAGAGLVVEEPRGEGPGRCGETAAGFSGYRLGGGDSFCQGQRDSLSSRT